MTRRLELPLWLRDNSHCFKRPVRRLLPSPSQGLLALAAAAAALSVLPSERAVLLPLPLGLPRRAMQLPRRRPLEEMPGPRPPGDGMPQRRQCLAAVLGAGTPSLLACARAAPAAAEAPAPLQPTAAELQEVRDAFAAISKDPAEQNNAWAELEGAEATFGRAIARFEGPLKRSQAEVAMLRMGRARSRILQNDIAFGKRPEKAAEAVDDLDVAIGIMDEDFKNNPGKAFYSEYADAIVRRGLAKEELKAWEGAVADYSRAINLWRPLPGRPDIPLKGNARPGEGDGLGVNPLVLNFRGNALSQLGRYEEALTDYQEASDIFLADGEVRQFSLSRANEALALFGAGRPEEATKMMQAVVRRDQGVTDMHVALAAVYWSEGKVGRAESEWQFACERISSGCKQYKDLTWVTEIRRWPPPLVAKLRDFLDGIAPKA